MLDDDGEKLPPTLSEESDAENKGLGELAPQAL
jgi:hypothetical protein